MYMYIYIYAYIECTCFYRSNSFHVPWVWSGDKGKQGAAGPKGATGAKGDEGAILKEFLMISRGISINVSGEAINHQFFFHHFS